MIAQGTTPLSVSGLTDKEITDKLVRVPQQRGSSDGGGLSFKNTLAETLNSSPGDAAKNPRRAREEKRLWDTCIEMESLLVGRMLKEMRKTVPKSEFLHGGFAEEIFEDMLYDEYAMNLSRNSNLGLAKMLYKELQRKL